MRKTDIPDQINYDYANGQRIKYQTVQTPFGEILVDGTVRVPKLTATLRTWKMWFKRFVLIRMDDNTSFLSFANKLRYSETLKKCQGK